jgi:hypothetical protein
VPRDDGRVKVTITLTCGHETAKLIPVSVYPGGKKVWWCEECHSLRQQK